MISLPVGLHASDSTLWFFESHDGLFNTWTRTLFHIMGRDSEKSLIRTTLIHTAHRRNLTRSGVPRIEQIHSTCEGFKSWSSGHGFTSGGVGRSLVAVLEDAMNYFD